MRCTVSYAIAALAATASAQAPLDVPGYHRLDLGNAAINAPDTSSCKTYIGQSTYSDGTFDPARCTADCEATTAYNLEHLGGRATCRAVNAYISLKDGVYQNQICAMYTHGWGKQYATNNGQITSGNQKLTITKSYIYTNITDPGDSKSCIVATSSTTSSTSTPTPTTLPNDGIDCFQARAWPTKISSVSGRYLQAKDKKTAHWATGASNATTFFLSNSGQWRNAKTGTYAVEGSTSNYGAVIFEALGNTKHTPLQSCKISLFKVGNGRKREYLTCTSQAGVGFYASKTLKFLFGTGVPSTAKVVYVEAVKKTCPAERWRYS